MVDDGPNGSPAWRALFSRTRSKTTIVSWTRKPITVSIAVTNRASISTPEERAQDGEHAHDHDDVVEQCDQRGGPELVAEPVGDPQQDGPGPERMSVSAWPVRSALTTGPTVVRLAWPSIGPRASSRATTISPSLPSVGRSWSPAAGGVLGDADGSADGEAEGSADAEADGAAEADAEGAAEAEADGAGEALAPGEPEAPGEAKPRPTARVSGPAPAAGRSARS